MIRKTGGENYYRKGQITVVTTTTLIGPVIPYYNGDSIKVCLVFALIGVLGGFIFWSSFYETINSTVGFRERLWGKYKDKYRWVNKMIYLPDDSRYYGVNENRKENVVDENKDGL